MDKNNLRVNKTAKTKKFKRALPHSEIVFKFKVIKNYLRSFMTLIQAKDYQLLSKREHEMASQVDFIEPIKDLSEFRIEK